MRLRLTFAFVLPLLLASIAQAQAPARQAPPRQVRAEPGSELTVTLLTMGVGPNVWEQFGHNAIWVHLERPPSAGGPVDVAYNWGIFDFRKPHFILNFLRGRMLYSMDGYDLNATIEDYRMHDRSVWAQELDLTNQEKIALRDFVIWNQQPENQQYYYDYYRDNCSTRVRDVLDRVLGGRIRATFGGRMTGHTYRWHTLRLTQNSQPMSTGIDIGLGRPADRELTAWEEMFLPMKLRDYVRELKVTGADGVVRPLVKSERVIYETRLHQEPDAPPRWESLFWAIGLVVAALFVWVGRRAAHGSAGARFAAGTLFSLWSFAAGVLGLLLFLLWTVTHHVFAHRNENLLMFHPLWLVLAVLAPMTAVKGRMSRLTRGLSFTFAGLALVGVVLHVVGLSAQRNLDVMGLGLPPILAMAWVVWRGTARPRGELASLRARDAAVV